MIHKCVNHIKHIMCTLKIKSYVKNIVKRFKSVCVCVCVCVCVPCDSQVSPDDSLVWNTHTKFILNPLGNVRDKTSDRTNPYVH